MTSSLKPVMKARPVISGIMDFRLPISGPSSLILALNSEPIMDSLMISPPKSSGPVLAFGAVF